MVESSGGLRHVRGEDCTVGTAQTPGMNRTAALSGESVGSEAIWMGETHMDAHTHSAPHHHGDSESALYIASGHPTFIYRDGDHEVRITTKPGDYVYVPPFVPHIEANDSDELAVVVIARSTQEAIVVNLEGL
ncbi:MAG: cupin domain-containing protein [Chloroflexota bacterium]